jgi:hypothetical protein
VTGRLRLRPGPYRVRIDDEAYAAFAAEVDVREGLSEFLVVPAQPLD